MLVVWSSCTNAASCNAAVYICHPNPGVQVCTVSRFPSSTLLPFFFLASLIKTE